MRYVAYLEYLPDVGTFRGQRGAWRVFDCFVTSQKPDRPKASDFPQPVLRLFVNRRLRAGTWTNPTALLRRGQIVTPFTNEGVTA